MVSLKLNEWSQGDFYACLLHIGARWHTFMAYILHFWLHKYGVAIAVVLKEFNTSYRVYWILSSHLSLHFSFFFFHPSSLPHSLLACLTRSFVGVFFSPCSFSHSLIAFYIYNMLHLATKSYSLLNGEVIHINTC